MNTNTKIILGLILISTVILVLFIFRKERFTLGSKGIIASSGTGTPSSPNNYLISDQGNISSSKNGIFDNLDVEGNISLKGYSGNSGDVIVSNGSSSAPVWAPGVGLSDFTGTNQNLSPNGYQIFPGGLIIQWGNVSNSNWVSWNTYFNFPIAFPNNLFTINITAYDASSGGNTPSQNNIILPLNMTKTSFAIESTTAQPFYWMAIGN